MKLKKTTNMQVITILQNCLTNAKDFFYPPLCILCNNKLSGDNSWLCDICINKLETNHTERDACPQCSMNRKKHECPCEFAWDHYCEKIFSFFDFDDTVQNIAHQFKYKGKKSIAYFLGKKFSDFIPDNYFDSVDAMISVPLHFLRKLERGYNQADFFAQGIIHGTNLKIPYLKNVLLRSKHTRTQTKLNREDRQKNLSNAFSINPKKKEYIRKKKIVLVDDIVTTGATTDFCTETLLNSGAESVRVISLART